MSTLIENICQILDQYGHNRSWQQICDQVHKSPFHLHREFKKATSLTPKQYADQVRMNKLRTLLAKYSVAQALLEAGFNSPSVLYDNIPQLGMTPKSYQNGAPNETICFALAQTSLGAICVAQSQKGVCFVQFSDDPLSTLEQLQKTFPHAFLQGADPTFDATVAQIVGLVEHANPTTIPLDARGTIFQKKVWDALQNIPLGQTWSYQQLANHIKMPSSVRAVANACAQNNIALLVPCHRVVRTNGDISGYRWGVERKDALLKAEKTLTQKADC